MVVQVHYSNQKMSLIFKGLFIIFTALVLCRFAYFKINIIRLSLFI